MEGGEERVLEEGRLRGEGIKGDEEMLEVDESSYGIIGVNRIIKR